MESNFPEKASQERIRIKEDYLELIRNKAEELGRLPKKADFSEAEVCRIKGFFGPWPRALEAAGVKEPRGDEALQRKREKHIRTKIRVREYKLKKRG